MPRPKPKFQDQKQYLQGVKYTPFNEEGFIMNTLLELHCPEGHTYIQSIGEIKRRNLDPKSCPHCKKEENMFKWREEHGIHRSELEEIGNKCDFELISNDEYFIRNEQEVTYRCIKCGKEKKFGTPRYILGLDGFKCDAKCERRVNTQYIERKEKTIVFKSVKVELLPQKFDKPLGEAKEILYEENGWHVVHYNGSKKKGTFQCKKCGEIKITYPCNVISKYKEKRKEGYNGCKGCNNIKTKSQVEEKILKEVNENNISIFFEQYNNIDEKMGFGCKNCGREFELSWREINRRYNKINCPYCHKSNKRGEQTEVYEYIKEIYDGEIIYEETKIIAPLQLDIYLPEENTAIEYCGTIWHSSKYIEDNQYHKKKLQACNEKGIRLITMFSDEWKNKNEIAKSRLNNLLNKSKSVYARKCEIRQIENKEALDFCETYHIQGKGQSNIAYGLFYGNELVSVMTFSLPMVSKSAKGYDYELNRFCSKVNVVGGASKLFKAFTRDCADKIVVSFCDLRWGTGVVYEKLGFEYVETTRPNYYYVGNKTNWDRKHRFGFTKKTLKERYNCLSSGTEKEIAQAIGLFQIYDCGHKKYVWRNQ